MSAAYASRFEAVFLCTHPRGPKLSIPAAARYMQKSVAFVRKWVRRWRETGTVDDLPQRGLTRTTTVREDRAIVALFLGAPSLTLRAGQRRLADRGIRVSLNTLRQRLREQDVAFRSTRPKPLLTPLHVQRRLQWAHTHADRDWGHVIFSDESTFMAIDVRRRAWSVRGQPVVVRRVKHPLKIHVWGCMSRNGFGRLCVFSETLTAERLLRIYQRCLLPSAERWYGADPAAWILQEDNDPKHRSRLSTHWKTEQGITTLPWPSQSPDANPIENVWSLMKLKLRGKRIPTRAALCRQIRAVWRSLPTRYAETLVDSMPRRCRAIISNNGDWTTY